MVTKTCGSGDEEEKKKDEEEVEKVEEGDPAFLWRPAHKREL